MSEKLQFDQDAAKSAVEHRTASNTAIEAVGRAERHTILAVNLGAIASRGTIGRFLARKEAATIRGELPAATGFDTRTGNKLTGPNTNVNDLQEKQYDTARQMWRVTAAEKANVDNNIVAHYDNTVIEANNDFINRGLGAVKQIRTPNVMQEQADAARALITPPEAQLQPQQTETMPQPQIPVNMVKQNMN